MSTAFRPADILIPQNVNNVNDTDTDNIISMEKWAVVACDQYTSEPEYWEDVSRIAGDERSALNLILPEVYLENSDVDKRIGRIHENMTEYIDSGIFKEYKDSMIYVERIQSDGKLRAGIVGMIDLEQYDYTKGSKSAVRATEATVVERIPPRIKVRRGAPVELPHIMILIDDTDRTVVEPLADKKSGFEKVYDFDLMKNGGHISGYVIDKRSCGEIVSALEKLGDINAFNAKYGLSETSPLVYAMGDGNHSLATAKEFYEEQKRRDPDKDMTKAACRYALVEIVNLHSPALEFEAIHRIVTGVDVNKLMAEMVVELDLAEDKSGQKITVVRDGRHKDMYIHNPSSKLTVGSLQNFLDKYIGENGGKVDYIHGAEVVDELSRKKSSVGFLLPDMAKSELFPTVIADGALPRKTFSMGHAEDKRFYIEARRIDG